MVGRIRSGNGERNRQATKRDGGNLRLQIGQPALIAVHDEMPD
jgi:hypothetical protein